MPGTVHASLVRNTGNDLARPARTTPLRITSVRGDRGDVDRTNGMVVAVTVAVAAVTVVTVGSVYFKSVKRYKRAK